jgi:hypothetical protein
MILNFWVISQILGVAVVLLLSVYAALQGVRILRRWNPASASEEQLELEKRTYLVSTLMQYALAFQMLSLLLFVATADYLASFISGAMCAFGSLNANSYGFATLWIKILTIFVYSSWLTINYLDSQAEDYPLVKLKYALLLLFLPLLITDIYLEIRYYTSISPNVITSCCGSALRTETNPYGFVAMNFPTNVAMLAFFIAYALTLGLLYTYLRRRQRRLALASGLASVAAFAVSLLAMFTFLSPYFNVVLFGLPTQHRCPFEVLRAPTIGYPFYALLFLGGISGSAVAVVEPLKAKPSLRNSAAKLQVQLAKLALLGFGGFLLISLAFMLLFYSMVGTVFYH